MGNTQLRSLPSQERCDATLTSRPQGFSHKKSLGRGNDASQTSFRLFEYITSETKESCVSRTDALLVGTGDQVIACVASVSSRGSTFFLLPL